MSASSTSVSASEDQTAESQSTEPQSRLQEYIATAEALDAQLEAASRRESSRVPVHSTSNTGPAEPGPERHRRKCKICHHRDRDLIEADFLEWSHPSQICEDYKVAYRALYRHAVATGLLERRRENVSIVVHKLLEEVEYVENPSAFAILRGVRTLASLDSRGRWTEPPTTHVVVNATERPAESSNPVTSSAQDSVPSFTRHGTQTTGYDQYSNRHSYEKSEPHVTHTKQSSDAVSGNNILDSANVARARCAEES